VIPREIIDDIMQATRIEEVIGEFIQLKKSGTSFKGLSPFSNEKTPSFYVSPAKQIFKDFSSGKGGSAVTFLMEHEHFTYPEALRWLAKKYNIAIPEEKREDEEAWRQAENERESLYLANDYANKFFVSQLWEGGEGQAVALSYFRERGFTDGTIQKFQLGYCPEQETSFWETATKAGYSMEVMLQAGLVKEKDGRFFDFFRGRVMFPIQNLTGRVIAFGGRTLKADKKIAKYFNSPETDIYHKSKVLYGIFQAKNAIIKNDACYLVEGYTDVLAMHQAGVENVVASSGTALTVEQIRLIRRYTEKITILYDGDPAGIRASFRGIDLILQEGMQVRVLLFPEGHDPDSFSRTVNTSELTAFIQTNSQDFVSFKADILFKDAGNDPMRRSEAIREIVESIAYIPDSIARSIFIKQCSERFDIPEQSLLNHHNKARRDQAKQRRPDAAPELDELPVESRPLPQPKLDLDEITPQERELIRLMVNYGNQIITLPSEAQEQNEPPPTTTVAEYILFSLKQDHIQISHPALREIADEFESMIEKKQFPAANHFLNHPEEQVRSTAIAMMGFDYQLSERWEQKHEVIVSREDHNLFDTVLHTVLSFRARHVGKMIKELQNKLKEQLSQEEELQVLSEMNQLKAIEIKLNATLGRDIIR